MYLYVRCKCQGVGVGHVCCMTTRRVLCVWCGAGGGCCVDAV